MSERTGAQLSLELLFSEGEQGHLDGPVPEANSQDLSSPNESDRAHLAVNISEETLIDEDAALAPMLRHYRSLKKQYPEHLLLYQVGDFYEVFFEDAKIVSEYLNIRLTSRNKDQPNPVPLCGVPIHALENYLPKILQRGASCVIMSQVEDDPGASVNPKKSGKAGMVRREISRIVTPGVRYQGDGLDEQRFNFLAAIAISARGNGAVSYTDVSTGHLRVQEAENLEEAIEILERIQPSEVILPSLLYQTAVDRRSGWFRDVKKRLGERHAHVVLRPFLQASRGTLSDRISARLPGKREQNVVPLLPKKFAELGSEALATINALLDYVDEVSFGTPPSLSVFRIEESTKTVFLDAATCRNLELSETRIDGDRRNSLLGQIDYTRTAMGSRLLTDWLLVPSADQVLLEQRLDSVEEFSKSSDKLATLRHLMTHIRDLDRLLSRLTSMRATPRDLGILQESLRCLPDIGSILSGGTATLLSELANDFDPLSDVSARLDNALLADLPVKFNEGGIFKDGYHPEVDRLREVAQNARGLLAKMESEERERTGISSLKVKYNNVFGYFIEVSKTHLAKIPTEYERKQTLVNAERFVTPQLKKFEVEILSARGRQIELERELFLELRQWLVEQVGRIQLTSRVLSNLDVLTSFAHLALEHNYCRPILENGLHLTVYGGRHPVVERVIGEQNFIANDVLLNGDERRFAILTGPNMGGKSTYLRQVALIQLLAQAGSFVPAKSARLGLVDRIFTRIGASDDLSRGDSTFMVEMRETASIIRRATSRSLVLIDEIGRGTATADGLSLATAVAEWIHDTTRCRTIFATHFHELTRLPERQEGSFCLSVGVDERDNEIIFTHRIEEKPGDKSYGIEVARLAGLPESLLRRASELLLEHEEQVEQTSNRRQSIPVSTAPVEVKPSVMPQELRAVVERLKTVNPNSTTPLQALQELVELKELSRKAY